jgi:ferredoxin-NADP reductase
MIPNQWFSSLITAVLPAGSDYLVLRLAKPRGYKYLPGQHAWINFGGDYGLFAFSFASHPKEPDLEICAVIRNVQVAPFRELMAGKAPIQVSAAAGGIKIPRKTKDKLDLFIAGGSGVSPFRSIFKELLAKGREIELFYGCKSPESFPYAEELQAWAKQFSNFKVHLIAEQPGLMRQGNVLDLLQTLPKNAYYYLCGPAEMVSKIINHLHKHGVPTKDILFEKH